MLETAEGGEVERADTEGEDRDGRRRETGRFIRTTRAVQGSDLNCSSRVDERRQSIVKTHTSSLRNPLFLHLRPLSVRRKL